MKKNKLVGLAALLLALGMAGCGEKEGGEQAGPCDKHTYADWVETKAATCTEKGSKERVCSVCGEKETAEIKVRSHSYEKVDAESSASTCTVKGKEVKKCSFCGNKTEKELDLADHTWADYTPDASDTEHEVVAATCEVAGKHFQKCSVCNTIQEVTDNALGHVYAKAENSDDDLVTWTKEVSCEEDGVGTKTCTRTGCGHIENVTATKLGHDMKLPEGEIIKPTDGTATVRMYSCAHEGCNKTELGFAADEVTAASKERLVVEEDGGTRFWGRPIGNAVPLNDKGDASEGNHPSIFDKKETGDFFEYKFNLTSEQATKLANAKLYCDAKPASYLSGKDFWANKSGDDDWTRGRYIDDNPDHLEATKGTRIKYDQEGQKVINAETQEVETETGVIGKEITDYRYILYVDGGVGHENELVPVEFDKTVSVPVRNETRMEYVMPYTFHLHAGVNTISLRMSGGYRSLFYNFIFRAVEEEPEEPEPVVHTHSFVFGAAAAGGEGECDRSIGYCTGCGKEVIKIASGKDLNGNLVQDDKLPTGSGGSYDGTKISKYVFNAAAGAGEIYAEAAFDSDGNGARSFYDGKEGSSNAFPLSGGKTNTVMTLNAANVTLPTKTYTELGLGETKNVFKMMKIADATFVEGANEFTMTATNYYGLKYKSLIFVTNKAHAHNFVDGTCACGLKRIVVAASSPTDGSLSSDKLQRGTSGSYDGTNGVKYTVTMPAAATVELQAKVWVDSGANWTEANGYSYYTGKVSGSTVKVLSDGSTNTVMKVNGANVTMPTTTYYAMGIRGTTADDAGIASYGSFNFTEGANTFELAATNSYGLCYGEFYILYR